MSKVNLNESSIGNNYAQELASVHGYIWEPADTELIYKTLFRAMAEYLSLVRDKKAPVALAIEDLKGNLKLAGVLSYHKNEDEEDMPGNWSFEIALTKEDLERDGIRIIKSTDSGFQKILEQVARTNSFKFNQPQIAFNMIESAVNVLLNWLDSNCKESGEEESVELEGYFLASVALENGEKVMSIVPDGAMKVLIKDDASIEK